MLLALPALASALFRAIGYLVFALAKLVTGSEASGAQTLDQPLDSFMVGDWEWPWASRDYQYLELDGESHDSSEEVLSSAVTAVGAGATWLGIVSWLVEWAEAVLSGAVEGLGIAFTALLFSYYAFDYAWAHYTVGRWGERREGERSTLGDSCVFVETM